jgi:hypothetical protein
LDNQSRGWSHHPWGESARLASLYFDYPEPFDGTFG